MLFRILNVRKFFVGDNKDLLLGHHLGLRLLVRCKPEVISTGAWRGTSFSVSKLSSPSVEAFLNVIDGDLR